MSSSQIEPYFYPSPGWAPHVIRMPCLLPPAVPSPITQTPELHSSSGLRFRVAKHRRLDAQTPSHRRPCWLLRWIRTAECRSPKSSEVLLNLVLPTRRRATPAATDARRRGGSCSPPTTAPSCSRGDAPRSRRRPTETTACLHLLQLPNIDNHMYRS
jgi:hypothetical protein